MSFTLCFLLASRLLLAFAKPSFPITASPPIPSHIFARQDFTSNVPSICGYGAGQKGWAAPASSKCMVDTEAGYFGFCALTKSNAKDCGFARACIDSHTCTKNKNGRGGCGRIGDQPYGTLTCTGEDNGYCYTNLLLAPTSATNNPPTTTYTYLGCAKSYRQATFVIATDVLPSPSALTNATTRPTSSLPVKAIIGGALGGLAIIATTALLFYFLRRTFSTRSLAAPHNRNSSSSADRSSQNGLIRRIEVENSMTAEMETHATMVEADEKAKAYEMPIPTAELGEGVERAELGVDASPRSP